MLRYYSKKTWKTEKLKMDSPSFSDNRSTVAVTTCTHVPWLGLDIDIIQATARYVRRTQRWFPAPQIRLAGMTQNAPSVPDSAA